MDMLVAEGWRDYELLDSGDGEKLERWGQYVIGRPEPKAMWKKGDKGLWKKADAIFTNEQWKFVSEPPYEWMVGYEELRFKLKPTDFRHTGVFPEQAVNWRWIAKQIRSNNLNNKKVLNLFAYTGGATMAAAIAGAHVTHVDSSRPALMWASENASAANITKDRIRWIQEDALKFVGRELRRGVKYDGIIMDPPKFGRGANGEIWKVETNLVELITAAKEIMSPEAKFFLVNVYTSDISSTAIGNLLSDVLEKKVEHGELGLKETSKGRVMPAGIFARWSC